MKLFWTPLALSEAQGFVTAYTVSYRQLNSGQLEVKQELAMRNSGSIVTGLQDEATYLVQVWASTSAGAGERTAIIAVQPLPATASPSGADTTGSIIGGVVAVMVIVIVAITIFAVVALTMNRKKSTEKAAK